MSVRPCRDCGHEVSIEADLCPHCGCKNPGREKKHAGGWIFLVIAFGVIAALIRNYILHH